MTDRNGAKPIPELGVLEWFEVGEHERVERVLAGLPELGVRRLRTGLSWAAWHAPEGREWYDWLLPRLSREVEVLPCVTYTPPSLGLEPRASSPPRRARDYADFLDLVLTRYAGCFSLVELWNEPNNRAEWDWTLDPEWRRFAEMVGAAAYWAKRRGLGTVLGGMSPVDPSWLWLMGEYGVLRWIDVAGIHGFPDTWETNWQGWARHVEEARGVLRTYNPSTAIWITEAGFSTWSHDDDGQLRTLVDVLEAPVPRVYWYAAEDLPPERAAITGFHADVRDYHFGLRRSDGSPKLLSRLLAQGGPPAVREVVRLGSRRAGGPVALITGGAGFVGTNLAKRLVADGRRVRILDSLARPGAEQNLRWLSSMAGDRVQFQLGDVRNRFALRRALDGASEVFHLAAQVAVTTSVDDPTEDLDVNLRGTHNLLEELRRLDEPPPLVFTSTNKVYGTLPGLRLELVDDRWEPVDVRLRESGLDERLPLDFCTPYGCSKGAADQYVLDYAKSFGLPALVFRMSCIYGPHQHGNEDQGWVAHFAIRALEGSPITIYGDGCQVRDLLFVEDLVSAFLLARDRVGELRGATYNMGGGPENAVSLLEVLELVSELLGERPRLRFAEERLGDQRYYVADTRRFRAATGWQPQVAVEEGIARLVRWLDGSRARRTAAAARVAAR